MPATDKSKGLRRLILWPAEAVVFLYVVLDAIAMPVVRPLLRWVAKLRFVIRLQDLVAVLPPYAILVLLAVPLAFAEPAKIYALVLMGQGHFTAGLVTIALAYLVSLVVVERIYHAGQTKLKTIVWFAKLMDWLTGNRDRLLAWARATMDLETIRGIQANGARSAGKAPALVSGRLRRGHAAATRIFAAPRHCSILTGTMRLRYSEVIDG